MKEKNLLLELLELVRGRYFGKYRGVVHSETKDPTSRGRIQVRVPAVLGDQAVWALPCVPYAGKNVGFHMLPPEKAAVWIEFEAGDISYPIWSGCFWAADEVPTSDELSAVKFIRTEKFMIRIDDATGKLVIENNIGDRITLSDLEIKLESVNIRSDAKTRNLSVNAANVSINDGTQQIS